MTQIAYLTGCTIFRAIVAGLLAGWRIAGWPNLTSPIDCLIRPSPTGSRNSEGRLSVAAERLYAVGMMNFFAKPSNLGMILLAAWLILFGVLTAPFLKFNFSHSGDLLAVLAIVVGVLLLLKR